MRLAGLVTFLSAAGPLAAEPFLDWPVACTLGQDCFVEDYTDLDPTGTARDYTCGLNTRDGHRGTDIAIPSFDALEGDGIAVLAAAEGTVLRIRDGMADTGRTVRVPSERACGNAVIIEHDGGWTTQYCHLRRGSITVRSGDPVSPGDEIGKIGLSGWTTHPHLHLTVYRDGTRIDPFAPEPNATCGGGQDTLWKAPPLYHATLLQLAGFATSVPDYDGLRSGSVRIDTAHPTDPLVVYAELGLAEDGDEVTIHAFGPKGEIFRNTRVMEAPRKSQLPAFGRRAPAGGWPAGDYTGQITVHRNGTLIASRFAHVVITAE